MAQTKTQTESEVIQTLQQQLANAFLLYTNYKKYHWESYGPLFRDLHLLFDEHATAVLGTIDELGERVRILGGRPVSDPRQFAERGSVRVAEGTQTMHEMVEQAVENHRRVIKEHRDAVNVATDANDPGTADLFTRNVQIHEKQEWFLRQVLEGKDGLVG
ncbi:MAG TPA: DNA starvation/stationary phase protection protein [Blastocatellia bacterium]|nr:DNA starvation/stationary phase protection protein [Blastocatellia bacterium]